MGPPLYVWKYKLQSIQRGTAMNRGCYRLLICIAISFLPFAGTLADSSSLVIPLTIPHSEGVTLTRGEMWSVVNTPELLVFSVDCNKCLVETPMSSLTGDKPLIWGDGAVHIYSGKTVQRSYRSSLTSNEADVQNGKIVSISRAGSVFTANPLSGWEFTSS